MNQQHNYGHSQGQGYNQFNNPYQSNHQNYNQSQSYGHNHGLAQSNYTQSQGYGQPTGYGQPQSYGQPQGGYNQSHHQGYGQSSTYSSYQSTQQSVNTYGGGFQPPHQGSLSQTTQIMNTQSYNTGTQQRSRPDQTVRPMTVKQLKIASRSDNDAPFIIDGHEAHVVCIVAQVTSMKEVTTFATVIVNDYSASFEVRVYIPVNGTTVSTNPLDVTESSPESIKTQMWLSAAQQGNWVKVFGTLKSWNQETYLSAKSIAPVTDYNELVMHRFQTIANHLYCTKGPCKSQQEGMASLKQNTTQIQDSMMNPSLMYGQPPQMCNNQINTMGSNSSMQFGSDPIRNCVMQYLNAPAQKGQGALQVPLLNHVHQTMGPKVTMQELASHLEWLSSEGHVYTGDTPDHFISCHNA